jgi:hypothetical protein
LQLFLGFRFAFRPEKSVGGAHSNFLGRKLLRVTEGEIRGHHRKTHAALPQKMRHHLLKRRRLLLCALHLALDLAEGNDLVRLRLLARAIDLEVAQNDGPLAVLLEKNEWVRHEEPCRVEHVWVVVARRDDETSLVFRFLSRAHLTFLLANHLLVIPSRARRRGTSHPQWFISKEIPRDPKNSPSATRKRWTYYEVPRRLRDSGGQAITSHDVSSAPAHLELSS